MITETQKHYFRNPAHRDVAAFYFTSNGAAFFKENDAAQQAANLKKQGRSDIVIFVTRAAYEAQLTAEREAGSTDPDLVQAQLDADASVTAQASAGAKLTDDNNAIKAGEVNLAAAQATGDAKTIADAESALQAAINKSGADAALKKEADDKAITASNRLAAKKAAKASKKSV